MHPFAHMMTGALIGQVAPTPIVALAGGVLSHYLLDALPHTEGATFSSAPRSAPARRFAVEIIEAGVEVGAGLLALAWMAGRCADWKPLSIGLGVLGALALDIVDQPLLVWFGVSLLHIPALHWTAKRRHAIGGILTQITVATLAGASLWRIGRCGG